MNDVLVLCYHAVSERWPAELAVTPHQLERQLASLVSRGYRGASFQEAVHSPPAPRTVAVTFDDAYRSVAQRARPVLERLGLPGTVFVPTAFPDTEAPMAWPGIDHWLGGPYEEELIPMSWAELASLAEAGWEIGSHTRTHPRLTGLDGAELAAELAGSRADCERHLGTDCLSLAYPFAAEDQQVVDAARAAGYTAAAALPERFRVAPLSWPRVGIYRSDSPRRARLKTAPTMRRVRETALWRVAAGGRRLVRGAADSRRRRA